MYGGGLAGWFFSVELAGALEVCLRLLELSEPPLEVFLGDLSAIELQFMVLGNWLTLVLLFIALASSSARVVFWLGVISALAALGSGWLFKAVLITRAAYNQGFALPRLPVRGSGSGGSAAKPGWR